MQTHAHRPPPPWNHYILAGSSHAGPTRPLAWGLPAPGTASRRAQIILNLNAPFSNLAFRRLREARFVPAAEARQKERCVSVPLSTGIEPTCLRVKSAVCCQLHQLSCDNLRFWREPLGTGSAGPKESSESQRNLAASCPLHLLHCMYMLDRVACLHTRGATQQVPVGVILGNPACHRHGRLGTRPHYGRRRSVKPAMSLTNATPV